MSNFLLLGVHLVIDAQQAAEKMMNNWSSILVVYTRYSHNKSGGGFLAEKRNECIQFFCFFAFSSAGNFFNILVQHRKE